VGGLLTLKPIGKLIDRFGRRPVLIFSGIGTVLTILPWAFIYPHMPDWGLAGAVNWLGARAGGLVGHGDLVLIPSGVPVGAFLAGAAAATIGGVAWSGIGLTQASYMLGVSESAGRSTYIAAFSIFSSIGGMLGGLAGGVLTQRLEFLQTSPIVLGPLAWNNWHISFLSSATIRLLALLMLLGLSDPTARPGAELLRHLAGGVYRRTLGLLPGAAK
jgi:MFS family permease